MTGALSALLPPLPPAWLRARGEVIAYCRKFEYLPPVVISLSQGVLDLSENVMKQSLRAKNWQDGAKVERQRIIDAAISISQFAPLPANSCWIEHDVEEGRIAYWVRPTKTGKEFVSVFFDRKTLRSWHPIALTSDSSAPLFGQVKDGPWLDALKENQDDVASMQLNMLSICAVLATPGVRTSESSRRDAKAMAKGISRRYSEITHRVVDVNLDELGAIPERGKPLEGGGSPRAMHHVRGHLRLTEKGLVSVRAHWRGKIENGLRLKDINYWRDEEVQQ